MKNIKSLLLVAVLSFVMFTSNVFAKDKVKVYIFEAGGCPYCEAEVEYLKGLDSYNEKFEIVMKELYVDHVDWEQGKDYELGVKVANAFLEKGFDQASYQGTPFVVISNIYAAASYSESLESVINKAYEDGDKDIVGCFEDGKDCSDKIEKNNSNIVTTDSKEDSKKEKDSNSITAVVVLVLIIGVGAALIVFARGKNKNVEEEIPTKVDTKFETPVEEVKKAETKPATKKTTTAKKTTTTKKTTTAKKPVKKTTKK